MNAFLIFNKEMRPRVLETNPNMTVAEISKTIGENWRGMSEVSYTIIIEVIYVFTNFFFYKLFTFFFLQFYRNKERFILKKLEI